MALDASEVRVAGTGALYKAPFGTAAPADSVIALAVAYEHLGYFSSDGVPIGFNDSVSNTVAWQGAQVVRSAVTESLATLSFTPIQTRGSVLQTFHRGSLITEVIPGEFVMDILPAKADPATWVFDAIDGGLHYRWYIPNGEITERGEVMHVSGEPIGYPMTMTFYPDSTLKIARLMSDDPALGLGI